MARAPSQGEIIRLQSEAVHPAVDLQSCGMAGQRVQEGFDLLEAVEAWDEHRLTHRICIPGHQPGKDVDIRARPEGVAQGHTLFRECHEEAPDARPLKRRRHRCRTETIGIGLDDRGGLDTRRRLRIEGAPVGDDGI